jgi:hypothetical protein
LRNEAVNDRRGRVSVHGQCGPNTARWLESKVAQSRMVFGTAAE